MRIEIVSAFMLLVISLVLFAMSVYILVTMLKEFNELKSAAIVMGSEFRESSEGFQFSQESLAKGLKETEEQYNAIQENYEIIIQTNRMLAEKIIQLENTQNVLFDSEIELN